MSPSLQVAVSLEEPSPSEQDDHPQKPVCASCRSTEITFDATAYWDAETQRFEYDIVKGEVFCLDCAEEHRPDWVPV